MSTKCFSLPFHPFCFLYYVAFTMFQVPFLSASTFYLSPYNNPMRQKQYSHLTDEENEACKLVEGETDSDASSPASELLTSTWTLPLHLLEWFQL